MDMELAYLAGFFDGEGCITHGMNGAWPKLRVSASQVDPAALRLLHSRFGGRLALLDKRKYNPNSRGIWEWSCWSSTARQSLEALLPLLRIKQSEAAAALRYAAHVSAGTRGRPLREDAATERHRLFDEWASVRHTTRSTQAGQYTEEERNDASRG